MDKRYNRKVMCWHRIEVLSCIPVALAVQPVPGLWISPGSPMAVGYGNTKRLCSCLRCCSLAWVMLSGCRSDTRWDHKAICLSRFKRQLKALAFLINMFSGGRLKLHSDFRPTKFDSLWVEGFDCRCRRIKRVCEQCSMTPKTLPAPCYV